MEIDSPNCIVSGVLYFVLRLSTYTGTTPLSFTKKGDNMQMQITTVMKIYCYAVTFVFNLFTMSSTIISLVMTPRKYFENFTIILLQVDAFLVCGIVLVAGFNMTKRMGSVINNINYVNIGTSIEIPKRTVAYKILSTKIIERLNRHAEWHRNDEKERRIVKLMLALVILLNMGNFAWFVIVKYPKINELVPNTVGLLTFCLVCLQYHQLFMEFTFIALSISKAIKIVNDCLEELLLSFEFMAFTKSLNYVTGQNSTRLNVPMSSVSNMVDSVCRLDKFSDQGMLSPSQSQLAQRNIRHLCVSYTALCRVITRINESHGLVLLLIVASLIYHFVWTPYNMIQYFSLEVSQRINIMLLEVAWLAYHCGLLWAIVHPGHKTEVEMTRTKNLIGQLMSRLLNTSEEPARAELNLFHRLTTLNDVYYAPMGMCVLRRRIIATIVGSITTYLVIMVQFQTSDIIDKHVEEN